MSNTITIFLVDDHLLFREGLKLALSQVDHFKVIDEASNGKEFLEKLQNVQPDIVLMDISMPEMDGITATEEALKLIPDLKVIAITSYGDDIYYHKMILAGASGFVQKKTNLEELQQAIENVNYGDSYFPPGLLRKFVASGKIGKSNTPKIQLSNREKEILTLICQGNSNIEIGNQLFISAKTVDNHRTNLLAKTGTRNSAHLVMFAITNHLVEF